MYNKFKNPMIFFVINWLILITLQTGIPLMLPGENLEVYMISFLNLSFNFFGENTQLAILIVSWIISLSIFAIFCQNKYSIPIKTIIYQIVILLFFLIFLYRYDNEFFMQNITNILLGFINSVFFISSLFLVIFVKKRITNFKNKESSEIDLTREKIISKCPFCGTEYKSNPLICYKCSKEIP